MVGLSTAWRLAQRGCRVRVVEQFALGHARGSSHGAARITRSTYASATYVQMVALAHAEDWPELEASTRRILLHRGGDAVVWGPEDGAIGDYAAAAGEAVVQLGVAEARGLFRGLLFPDAERVLWDRSAAVVAAADTMRALWEACEPLPVRVIAGARVAGWELTGDGVAVRVEGLEGVEDLHADRIVVAAGPWTSALLGWPTLTPVRQDVGYWALPGSVAGEFPCFIHLGGGDSGVHYGLPGIGEEALKAAFHRTSGTADDPDIARIDADPASLAAVEARLRTWFRGVGPLLRSETCFYTNTPTEDFVLDVVPGTDGRVVVGAGLSGHGFKFGPLLGRILADLALTGTSPVAPYAADRRRFQLRL